MTTQNHSKICFKCCLCKPLSDFYKHPRMKDGHVNKCKECNKEDVRVNYRDNHEYYLEYDKDRAKDPCRNKAMSSFRKTSELRYPERKQAAIKVSRAIRSGKLIRPTYCHHCGDSSKVIEAHHSSYAEDMVYVVTWLCTTCHGLVHSPSLYNTKE